MRSRIAAAFLFWGAFMASGNAGTRSDSVPVRMEFQIDQKDFGELMGVLVQYSHQEKWRVENIGQNMPPKNGRYVFYVNLFEGESLEIAVSNFLKEDKMLLFFYDKEKSDRSKAVLDSFIAKIGKRWPDLHVYNGL